jgi:hypothetical protein
MGRRRFRRVPELPGPVRQGRQTGERTGAGSLQLRGERDLSEPERSCGGRLMMYVKTRDPDNMYECHDSEEGSRLSAGGHFHVEKGIRSAVELFVHVIFHCGSHLRRVAA